MFLVRKSESMQNCYVLSVKVPKYINHSFIAHYLIDKSRGAYYIRGSLEKFTSLESLINHCSEQRDILPIILNYDYYEQKQELVNQLSHVRTNEFLYYSSGSSIGSSNFSIDNNSF